MVDLHSHILPCFDDGSGSPEETIRLIDMEIADGVRALALTPHFIFEQHELDSFLKKRDEAVCALKNSLNVSNVSIQTLAGGEIALDPGLLNESRLRELCYEGTDFMLVELPRNCYSKWIPDVLYKLKLNGISPVLAHVERYPYFKLHPELLLELVESGCIAQVNASGIVMGEHRTRAFIGTLIKHNLVHIIASDAHSVTRRPPCIKDAMHILKKKYGCAFTDYLIRNSESIVENIEPELYDPVKFRKGFLQ